MISLKAPIGAVVIATMATVLSLGASASERGTRAGWSVHQPVRFLVSGVLRRDGTTDVIKPIHSIVTADDEGAAVASFSRSALASYQGYTLIATLVSPVPTVGTCENNI